MSSSFRPPAHNEVHLSARVLSYSAGKDEQRQLEKSSPTSHGHPVRRIEANKREGSRLDLKPQFIITDCVDSWAEFPSDSNGQKSQSRLLTFADVIVHIPLICSKK